MLSSEELPSMDVWDVYKEIKGVQSLYAWQREFLEQEDLILARKNYILWIPTGAGKTLVAELLLIREAIVRKRNCLFILPYVAIVQEKIASLTQLEDKMDIIIEEYAASKGRFPPIKRRNAQSIYVCTIEKANHLVNSLVENGRLHELGLAIVDELHMVGESGGRGAILEQCLCKMMHSSRREQPDGIQIVGMSATLGNPDELCTFLKANKFWTPFRPVKLIERIKVAEKLYRVKEQGEWELEMQLPKNKNGTEKRDPDGLSMLLGNLMKGQVLIFCPTKENCENLCKLLASLSPREFREHRAQERLNVVTQLQEEHEGKVCPILCAGIMHGVAYHHSGLTQDERLLVETAYKNGTISIICCTSTLAAGVNLPARRVIIRSPYVGRSPLRKTQYLQMIGRAGRAGLDEKGDSILILHQGHEITQFQKMQEGPLEPSISGLCDEQQREAFFLDLIVLKLCSSVDDLHEMLRNSLFGIQFGVNDAALRDLTEKTVQSLLNKQMLKTEIDQFLATQIGSATFNAHLNPQMALMMSKDLAENLAQGIVLSSHFHLLYNCVPLDIDLQNLDWNIFHNEYLTLSREEQNLINLMGFHESTILHSILSARGAKKTSLKAQRLYAALMLRKIWSQNPLWEVAQHYHVPRGWLQSLLQSTVSQSSSIVRFSERMPALWSLKSLLPEMVNRLSECSRQELIPLLGVECIKMGRARQLYEQGYRCVGSIARATAAELIGALEGKLSRIQANRMINSAKTIIRDQIAEKTEELEQLVSGNGGNAGEEHILSFSMSLNDKSLTPSSPPKMPPSSSSSLPSTTMLRLGLEPEAEEDDEDDDGNSRMSNSPSSGVS